MTRNLLIAATLLALAGCSEPKPEATQTSAAPASATAPAVASTAAPASKAVVSCAGTPDCDLLPPSVVVVVTHKLRRQSAYTAKPGDSRKQVVFEYMDGTADANMQSIEQSMAAAGFDNPVKQGAAAGTISASFHKEGYGKVNVWVSSDVGAKPKWPKAKGVIGFDFPAPGAMTQTAGN
jgi:uncharacterized lipoprotein YajG